MNQQNEFELPKKIPTEIDGPVIAIGDVHAHCTGLKLLLEHLKKNIPDYDNCWLVFLGDYVDRGSECKETIDFLIDLWENRPKTTFVMGNHDLAFSMFNKLIPEPFKGAFKFHKHLLSPKEYDSKMIDQENVHLQGLRYRYIYSSDSTFDSYNVPYSDNVKFQEVLPTKHKHFFRSLPWCVEHPDYIFVHAGIGYEETSLEKIKKQDLSDPRPTWLCDRLHLEAPKLFNKTIVSGHYGFSEVIFRKNRIINDTTAGETPYITAVLLPDNKVFCLEGKVEIEKN
ncbi:hypothetical protein M0813_16685 [Anaeramoeba flamelloides]|uniref:Calcineurin-like phosphoesterase domain-containing protein n=1 Tax=Anaeramoeba flamelloides TaxID=1746091 RepID=A0ABQ8YZM4_9EUKA|nr:hypothetical protein M0813_16685 [Anaeramoeba flamelloides]